MSDSLFFWSLSILLYIPIKPSPLNKRNHSHHSSVILGIPLARAGAVTITAVRAENLKGSKRREF
jgi:hypothetical protein